MFSLLQPLFEIPLAFVDVETTGASTDFGHRVIELGIVRIEGGRVVAEYQQLIDPNRRISPGVTALTGISQDMVTGQPDFSRQLPAAMELLRGAAVIGHNVRFDLGFLGYEFRRAGQEIAVALGERVPVFDTVRIARRRFGRGGNALQRLAPRLGVTPTVAHRALADAQTTAGVFEKLLEFQAHWQTPLCDAVAAQGGPMGLLPASPRESLLPLELEEALESRGVVHMEYLDARQSRTVRVIQPLHLRRVSGELFLVAHCQLRNDRRTFKLDRIVQFIKPPAAEAAVLVEPPAAPIVVSHERIAEPPGKQVDPDAAAHQPAADGAGIICQPPPGA